jgi:uncharacterized protein (TIGR03067 family)
LGRQAFPRAPYERTIYNPFTTCAASRLTLEAMKLLRHIIIVCLLATFSANAGEQLTANAKCAANQPTNAELQLLQGTWEGFSLQRETGDGPIVKGTNTITVTVTGDTLHFQRDTNFWFETAITLQAGTKPQQLHAKIKRGSNSTGEVVVVIYKIEEGTLTLATDNGSEDALKVFEDAPNRYELRKVQPQKKLSGSGLGSLVLEGHELHASLKTRQLDDSDRRHHVPRALLPGNPHVSTNAAFVAAIATCASQGSLGRDGVRSALYALYLGKKELGFYGLEAESAAEADRWEGAMRKVMSHNVRLGMMQVHRQGLVLVVVWRDWPDGVSPECWKAVNASIVERLSAP